MSIIGTSNQWEFWVDRGGTFTDIVGCNPNGTLVTHKLLSENPEQYPDAALQGIRDLMGVDEHSPIPVDKIRAVKMGTTVATNALLERKGDPTLLLITQGFGDLLRIGYQNRPKLFDLDIKLPELLYSQVAEVPERIAADGAVLVALDEMAVKRSLISAFDAGIRSVAIALMHGFRFPIHENRIAELAKEVGFTQVSVSHDVSPLIKIVARGDTTVVDAYLSPILRRYVEQVTFALDVSDDSGRSVMFMQSNGGLTDANLFQGKDAILSGPAGGVVGMVQPAKEAGFDKLIGFDMGGTSTDVCHYAGEFERSFDTEVAGVRMRAPMMHVHTVAAGGGSILKFENQRFQVGPESAGASPGPASYGRGGPLTVTDCNVVLGKLQPDHFPHVFGPTSDAPLDVAIVEEKFKELARQVSTETGQPVRSVEEIAEGYLRIAVENMANAIKKISVQRGYDVTGYTLNCFGGAGGQHACLVADALGMTKIFVHPFAGVLSAFGMGLADIRAIREKQFERPIDDYAAACDMIAKLSQEATSEVSSQGIASSSIRVEQQAHIRYDGSHQALTVPFGDVDDMKAAFETAHRARYGFVPSYGTLIIEVLSAEAIGETGAGGFDMSVAAETQLPATQISMHTGGETQDVLLHQRQNLQSGVCVQGPAIIAEPTGTNIVEAGWTATVDASGNLIMTRSEPQVNEVAIGTSADPIMLEVFNNLFMSIAEQMGATLANTAYSVNIKERLDFSCAVFDQNGDLVANAPHVPVHLGSMGESVRTILDMNAGNIRPGDVYMMNAPFNGGTHLPDVTVITPVFDKAGTSIQFVVASRGHHADIGGTTPGSGPPDSRTIHEEGVLIDNFKLVDAGTWQDDAVRELLGSGAWPCRNPDQNIADLAAQVAANTTGTVELQHMVSQFGIDVVQSYMGHVQDNAEEAVRRVISVLKKCDFTYALDSGAVIKVAVSIDQETRSATVDFSGTSDQDAGNYNAPASICRAVVLYVFRTLVGSNIPLNEGCLKPITLILPEHSMINPDYPAAVIAGNTEVSQAIADTLFGALGNVAGSQGTMNNFVWGNEEYQNYETICGGAGAGPDFDGASAVHTHMTNTRMTDPEVLETRFPVRIEEFSIRDGSGGKGACTGGDGITRKLRFLEPMTATVLSSHRLTRPFGVAGGEDGAPGSNSVERSSGEIEQLDGNDARNMDTGDVFIMHTPGGGGYGLKPS